MPLVTAGSHPSSYRDRLSLHIDDYIQAVLDFPDVRSREFLELKDYAQLYEPRKLLEVPTEGCMLDRLFPHACIDRVDFLKLAVPGYAEGVMVSGWSLNGVSADTYDAVLSVVPIHHASSHEKRQYLQGALRVLKPGCVLTFAEVEAGSSVHRFLDEFVDANTATGHRGEYPDASFCETMSADGFVQVSSEQRNCPWLFDTGETLHTYMTRLFALNAMPTETLLAALDTYLGLSRVNGKPILNWPLRFFRGVKPLCA